MSVWRHFPSTRLSGRSGLSSRLPLSQERKYNEGSNCLYPPSLCSVPRRSALYVLSVGEESNAKKTDTMSPDPFVSSNDPFVSSLSWTDPGTVGHLR